MWGAGAVTYRTEAFSARNSWRLRASTRKSVSSLKLSQSSPTTALRSRNWSPPMKGATWRTTVRMISMSWPMTSRTRGRWTFTATSSPVRSVARCTWAMEALPRGVSSTWEKTSPTGRPYSCSSTSTTVW